MVAARVGQVVAELMFLLQGLLRDIAIATHRDATWEDEIRQVSRCQNLVVEGRILIDKLVDGAAIRRVRPRAQDVVKAIERLVAAGQVCADNQEARLIVKRVVVLACEAHD